MSLMAEHTGGMVALIPRAQDAAALAVRGGEAAEELHLTLCYLGDDVTDWSAGRRNVVVSQVADAASRFGPIAARTFATATFNPDGAEGRTPCATFLVGDCDAVTMLHEGLRHVAATEQHSPFVPHITIGYGLKADKLGPVGPVMFDRLRIKFGDQLYDFPLGEEKELLMDFYEFKRKFTAEDRDKLAKTPKAQDDGSYPIENIQDLKNAVQAFGRAKDKDKTKAHIIRNAKRLKATNVLPKDWGVSEKSLTVSEFATLVEEKVMSGDPRAARLREHWAHGAGRKKWHDWDSLRRQLKKYVKDPRILDGLTANIYRLATGRHPGQRKDVRHISAEEFKAAMLLADPDAELSEEDLNFDVEDSDPEDVDEAFEQAVMDDMEWDLDAYGELVPDEENDVDEVESAGTSEVRPGPRQVSLFD